MVKPQQLDSTDGIVALPLFGGAIAARVEQAVKDTEKDGAFDRELEASPGQSSVQNVVDGTGFPEPLTDQSGTDFSTAGGDAVAVEMGAEDGELFREPSERDNEGIELAAGNELIQAAEAMEDVLLDLAIDPAILHDEEIGAGAVALSPDEHLGTPVTPV
jgi:hypothetical protein